MPVEVTTHICLFAPLKDILSLMQTCKCFHEVGKRMLYRRDAFEENSSSISWAAFHEDEDLAVSTMKFAHKNKGNLDALHRKGNATYTAFHVAAALKKFKVVEFLIDERADPSIAATDFHTVLPSYLSNEIKNLALIPALDDMFIRSLHGQRWLPLMVPCLLADLEYREVIQLMRRKIMTKKETQERHNDDDQQRNPRQRAPVLLTSVTRRDTLPRDPPNDPWCRYCAFTMLHAAMITEGRAEHIVFRRLVRECTQVLNMQMPGTLYTAIHLAAKLGYEPAMIPLMTARADANRLDALGNAPLHWVIINATRQCLQVRKPMEKMTGWLLQAGADVNLRRDSMVQETPLTLLGYRMRDDWPNAHHHIKAILKLLVEGQADLNQTDVVSSTILFGIMAAINSRRESRGSPALENLFDFAIQHGADPTITMLLPARSILAEAIRSPASPNFKKRLTAEYGLRILDSEAGMVLHQWATSKHWHTEYDILQHADVISQDAANRATNEAFLHRRGQQFLKLQEQFAYTGNREANLMGSIKDYGNMKKKLLPLTFHFDPLWMWEGSGFLHAVVKKFLIKDEYPAAASMADAKQLIARGVPVKMKNKDGRTALQELKRPAELDPKFPKDWPAFIRFKRLLEREEAEAEAAEAAQEQASN